MGRWERTGVLLEKMYRQIVREGFILTQGSLNLHFDDFPFGNTSPIFPSFQLLMVHRNHPFEIVDSGKISVGPCRDKRLLGDILRDKNPNVYDSVSFFLAPWDIQLPEQYPGRVFTKFDGFETSEGKRNIASLVYVGGRGFNIDGQYVRTASTIIPPQIPSHFNYWLYHPGIVQAYDGKAKAGEEWKDVGRFDLRDIGRVAYTVAQELEKRFKTRILTKHRPD